MGLPDSVIFMRLNPVGFFVCVAGRVNICRMLNFLLIVMPTVGSSNMFAPMLSIFGDTMQGSVAGAAAPMLAEQANPERLDQTLYMHSAHSWYCYDSNKMA